MENDKVMELVDRLVKDKIKERDGYKLTGTALGTALANGFRLFVIGRFNEGGSLIAFSDFFFWTGFILFLVSLYQNIKTIHKYKGERKIDRIKCILGMLVTILYGFVASTLLWGYFYEFLGV